jgi:hypothetical protein
MTLAIRYHFSQHFNVSARKAYEWYTDYDPGDHELMGDEDAKRLITRLTESTVILTDVYPNSEGVVEKQKLVQFYPHRLSWIATHLTGPNKYSQFIYEISDENGETSLFNFEGLYLDYEKEDLDTVEIAKLTKKLRGEDAKCWRLLAEAMQKEIGRQ